MTPIEYDHLGCMYLWFEIEFEIVDLDACDLDLNRKSIRTDEVYASLIAKIERELRWKLLSNMEFQKRAFPPPATAGSSATREGHPLRRFVTMWKMPALNPGQAFFKGDQMLGTWEEYGLLYPYITDQREQVLQPALFNPRRVWAHGERSHGDTAEEDVSLSYEDTFPFEEDLIVETGSPGKLAYLPLSKYGGQKVTEDAPDHVKYLVHEGVATARIPEDKLPAGQGPAYLVNLAALKRRTGRS